jgi:hypothetical protein
VVPKKNWSKPPHHRPNHTHAYSVQRFFRVVVEAGGEFRPRGTFPQRGDFAHQLASFVFSCSPCDRPHRWEGWRSLQSKQRIKKSVSSDHTRPCIGTSQKQIQRRAQSNLHSDPSLSFQSVVGTGSCTTSGSTNRHHPCTCTYLPFSFSPCLRVLVTPFVHHQGGFRLLNVPENQ